MSKQRHLSYLALLTTSIIWGLAPPVIKYTLGFVSPTAFLFYRFLLVSIILFIPLILRLKQLNSRSNKQLNLQSNSQPNPQSNSQLNQQLNSQSNQQSNRQSNSRSNNLSRYLLLGFLATPLNLFLLFEGIKRTSATDASVISIISPMLVVIGGAYFLKEKVEKHEMIGIAVTLSGALLTILQPILENGLGSPENLLGNFLVFAGALVWSIFILGSKKHQNLDPFILTSLSFVLGAILFLPLFLLGLSPNLPVLPPLLALPGILFMSVFGSLVAYFTFIWGLSKIEASEATVFTYLQPLFAIPLAAVWLKEPLTPTFLAGAALIGLGVFICESRK